MRYVHGQKKHAHGQKTKKERPYGASVVFSYRQGRVRRTR